MRYNSLNLIINLYLKRSISFDHIIGYVCSYKPYKFKFYCPDFYNYYRYMSLEQTKPALSLKNFTHKIIDYAGLFPPASLELAQAFHNFIFYSQGESKWMLNKFIIPAARLNELSELMAGMKIEGTIPFSVLSSGGNTIADFNKTFDADIESMKAFVSLHGELVSIDAVETRVPKEIIEQEHEDDMLDLMISVSDKLEKALGKTVPVFYEAALNENHETIIIRVVETIAALNKSCGFKLRTGGTEPSAFPSAEVIAFAIISCCEFAVPMKCTAGLHHPIKHYNDGVKSDMHGFFNIFGAGILAYTNDLDEMEIIEILNDEDPYEFIFSEEGFEYDEIKVTNAEIKAARENFILSYGSCSFDEPIEDLKMLELL